MWFVKETETNNVIQRDYRDITNVIWKNGIEILMVFVFKLSAQNIFILIICF